MADAKNKPAPVRGEEGFAEPEQTKEQTEQLGAGREVEKDRTDKPAAKPTAASKATPSEYPDTPSGKALAKVGADGDGEAYAAEKKKHRWG